jgi:ribosome-associated protein
MAKSDKGRKTARLRDELAWAVQAAQDKLATDIVVLDLRNVASFTDEFLICTGHNARQIRAIADGVLDALASHGAKPAHVEGYDRSDWVLIDYFDFIVHVFATETREFYGLERLWGSAEHVDVPAAARPPRRRKI